MKHVLFNILLALIAAGCHTDYPETYKGSIRIPGEFEPHEALWLGYRYAEDYGRDSVKVVVSDEMIKALNPHIHVNLVVEHDSLFPDGLTHFGKMSLDTGRIKIFYQSPTDGYYRDPGPIFGYTRSGGLAVADFRYTNYTNVLPDSVSETAMGQDGIDRDVAQRLGLPVVKSIVALEGGAFETNGKGSAIQCEAVTLGRNPHLTKEEIEADYRKNFGITNVIWLPSGVVDDPHNMARIHGDIWGFGTGGHTDEFVRFANDSTILLAWVDAEESEDHILHALNYEVLSENYQILKQSRDTEGKPFKIIKVPHPEPDFDTWIVDSSDLSSDTSMEYYQKKGISHGDTIRWVAASSYMNYVITNGVVIIPEYWEEGKSTIVKEKDLKVREIFEALYPDRCVVGINPIEFNRGGGGMHCRYQSQPLIR